ncbi:Omp28-related outer membrane protein [Butyricimonas sp. Marseille-P3923]|uniref:Omp28-related outer membrane protein n=1 Tax=Butyricimonas sp. Marseille-P3923 TaxID=1987504 RepID=UPI000C077F3C|nr:Omp28-related outer membrane protein [Butyricimonas sp. Marseille-P3923]
MKKYLYSFVWNVFFFLLMACGGGSDDSSKNETGLVLTADKTELLANGEDRLVLSVHKDGKDVTSGSSFSVSAGTDGLKDNVFVARKKGKYVFQARYEGEMSNSLSVEAGVENVFRKNLLFQMMTSVTCIVCPDTEKQLESISEANPGKVFIIEYHGNLDAPDPFATKESLAALEYLWDEIGTTRGFGGAYYDYVGRLSATNQKQVVRERLSVKGNQGIALETSIAGDIIRVTAKVKTLIEFKDEYRLAVAITENECRGGGYGPYDYVFRKYLSDIKGDKISDMVGTGECSKNFEGTLSPDYDKEHLFVIVYLIRVKEDGTKEVVNCSGVKAGENLDYVMAGYEAGQEE